MTPACYKTLQKACVRSTVVPVEVVELVVRCVLVAVVVVVVVAETVVVVVVAAAAVAIAVEIKSTCKIQRSLYTR